MGPEVDSSSDHSDSDRFEVPLEERWAVAQAQDGRCITVGQGDQAFVLSTAFMHSKTADLYVSLNVLVSNTLSFPYKLYRPSFYSLQILSAVPR